MNLQIMFRDLVDGALITFFTSMCMVDLLEKMGLKIERVKSDTPVFGELFNIQKAAVTMILEFLSVDPDYDYNEERPSIYASLDEFLFELCEENGMMKKLPDNDYLRLLELLRSYEIALPWELDGKER